MRKLVIIAFLAANSLLYGQQLNFRQVDTATYNNYLKQDWKEVIRLGQTAMDQGIDYYYLQMRIAYSYFSLGKYRQAIKYYNNALTFNRFDPLANEFLYYSYTYSGRESDALFKRSDLTESQKLAMKVNQASRLLSIGWTFSNLFTNAHLIQDNIFVSSTTLDGVQKATHSLYSPSLSLSHKLNNRVFAEHTVSYLSKDELSYVISNGTEYISTEQNMRQFEYKLDLGITLAEGLIVKPGVHFLSSKVPLFLETDYGNFPGRDRVAVADLTFREFIPKIQIEKRTTFFDLGISYVHIGFNNINTHQLGVHATAYPFANLNLYLSFDAYARSLGFSGSSVSNFILKPRVGFKLHTNLWVELAATFPEHMNFYDVRNNLAYNGLEKTASTFEIDGFIPLYKPGITIFLGYRYQSVNSYYFPDSNLLDPINKQTYLNHLITGGIKWKM